MVIKEENDYLSKRRVREVIEKGIAGAIDAHRKNPSSSIHRAVAHGYEELLKELVEKIRR